MSAVGTAFYGQHFHASAEHLTFDQGSSVTDDSDGTSNTSSLALTNCLITGVTSNGVVSLTTNNVAKLSSSSGVYQTVGGGAYYLTNSSPYRNCGTTTINAELLAELRQKTTYPPVIYVNTTFSTPTNFAPRVPRDTNSNPDLGYHYDPLDYVFGHCQFNTNINFTAGTAVGWYRPSSGWYHDGYGIFINDKQTLTFQGTATSPCWWVRLNIVQENDTTAGYGPGGLDGEADQYAGDIGRSPIVQANFARFSLFAGDSSHLRDDYGYIILNAVNCEFYSGGLGGYLPSFNITNCLFEGCGLGNTEGHPGNFVHIQNCTFHHAGLSITTPNAIPVSVINCSVDDSAVYISSQGANTNFVTYDYNAYTASANPFMVGGVHDVVLTNGFNWQKSWMGNYYLPSNSPLIDHGNTNATYLGLYHFTTQINQAKEAGSTVDIGYHYVAVDNNGNPIDSNNNGVPDYLENNIYGLPDWWVLTYFGNLSHYALDLDLSGAFTLLYDYQNGLDPTNVDRDGDLHFDQRFSVHIFAPQ